MVSIATQLRASRAVVLARPWARHPAPAGAQLPLGDIAFVCQSQLNCGQHGRRVAAAKSRRLPPEDIAFMCQSQQNRVCRGGVSNRTQGASSSPVGARVPRQCHRQDQKRVLLSAGARCGAMRNKNACAAAVVSTKLWARRPAPGGTKRNRDSGTHKRVSESRLLFFCYF